MQVFHTNRTVLSQLILNTLVSLLLRHMKAAATRVAVEKVALDKTSVHEQQRLASSRNTGAALRSHGNVMNLVCFQEPP